MDAAGSLTYARRLAYNPNRARAVCLAGVSDAMQTTHTIGLRKVPRRRAREQQLEALAHRIVAEVDQLRRAGVSPLDTARHHVAKAFELGRADQLDETEHRCGE